MSPTLKSFGAYWLRLVSQGPSNKKTKASVLKFHEWIPRQNFLPCLYYFPLSSYAPFNGSEFNFVSKSIVVRNVKLGQLIKNDEEIN